MATTQAQREASDALKQSQKDEQAAQKAEAAARTADAAAASARAKANASARDAADKAAKANPPVATTPHPAPANPAPAPKPAPPAPAPPVPPVVQPAPAPKPPVTPTAADPRYLDKSLLKTPVLDHVFARDGLGLKSNGGPFDTRRQYGVMNDDPNGMGWDNRSNTNPALTSFFSDAALGKAVGENMDPFTLQSNGAHILIREFTASQRAKVYPTQAEIQRCDFWSGNLIKYGVPPSFYASVKLKSPGVLGQLPCVVAYTVPWAYEADSAEIAVGGGSDCTLHKWAADADHPLAPFHDPYQICKPVMADGSPVPNSDVEFVDFGLLVTPGRMRWYRNGIMTRDRATEMIKHPWLLQVGNQAMFGQAWGRVGPLAVADTPRADLVVEWVRIWAV